jgi:hypothetical protein
MPYIKNEQVQRLLDAESYLWEHSDWRDNEEAEKALWNIWQTLEEILGAKYIENKRSKLYMRAKRKDNPQYGREKKEI